MNLPSHEATEDVASLLDGARNGDQRAWRGLVHRYGPLVMGVGRRYRLSAQDAEDVCQTVWLKLFENLGSLREAAALPGWLVTTTQRQAIRVLTGQARAVCVGSVELLADGSRLGPPPAGVDEQLLGQERDQAVRDGLEELTAGQRNLLLLVTADPPIAYTEISGKLDMPVGSIGPTRARYLRKLGRTTAIREYTDSVPA